jgi:CheY-like chemotaxis protein
MVAPTRPAVLVAEDNPFSLDVLLLQLRGLGCDAVGAEDGAAAERAWRDRAFALVLTDLQMPNLDGFGLAARIRAGEAEGAGRLPIVALTASDAAGDADRCRAAGMDGLVAKPASTEALRALVARWLGPTAAGA